MAILVTGGAGFIGSHICVELLNNGYDVIVVDNLSNSYKEVFERIFKIIGKNVTFYKGDILDANFLNTIFEKENIETCIHLAGLKAVGESTEKPLLYYHNNVVGTLVLLETMKKHNVKNIIFSSTATVYGIPETIPVTENHKVSDATNPYGQSKIMIERILIDQSKSDKEWNVTLLRYFNPIGAHESGLIGENPKGIPNNLIPYITQVAIGNKDKLYVFGNDYNTHDGTGVRDYIHVVDLAKGHICAVNKINDNHGVAIYNLGTGTGYSVFDVIHAFENANNIKIPYEIMPRRNGDIDCCYADPSKANKELGWAATKTLEDMCKDSYHWQTMNPEGYETIKPEATLVIMAAGVGSRFGSKTKQLEKIGPNDETLIDYSIKSAKKAGFNKVIFIIRKDIKNEFIETVGNRTSKIMKVSYVYQEIDDLPFDFKCPKNRTKPWGTGHAILACRGIIDGPFAIINADDHYGDTAFSKIYEFITTNSSENNACVITFMLKNTLSAHGTVTRGLCEIDNDKLIAINETKNITRSENKIIIKTDNSELNPDTKVSMNMWGMPAKFIDHLYMEFKAFLSGLKRNDTDSEFLIPNVINKMVKEKQLTVTCLESNDEWFGLTYENDVKTVTHKIKNMKQKG